MNWILCESSLLVTSFIWSPIQELQLPKGKYSRLCRYIRFSFYTSTIQTILTFWSEKHVKKK
jgi:hypothetical protein